LEAGNDLELCPALGTRERVGVTDLRDERGVARLLEVQAEVHEVHDHLDVALGLHVAHEADR
jgi:hypothetical protein